MTEQPAQQEIDELVRRLETTTYSAADIREAGEILAMAQSAPTTYTMALGFWESPNPQVRALSVSMMEAVAPQHEAARGFLAGAKDTAKLLADAVKPNVPDYSALGEVIKLWMRQHREQRKRR